MPALQVRDFPQELYQELKDYAAVNHRSMAQQTIAAVSQMIHGETPKEETAHQSEVATRVAKRKEILARAAQRRAERQRDLMNPVDVVAEGRAERDADFTRIMRELSDSKQW